MTPSEVVQRMVDAWNSGDRATYMASVSPDVTQDVGQFSERSGAQAWGAGWDGLHKAFPDCRIRVQATVGPGPNPTHLAVVATFSGTYTGGGLTFPEVGMGEIAATGQKVSFPACATYRVEDDLIVEQNIYGFGLPLLMQLGAASAPAAVVQKMWDAVNANDKAAYMAVASPDVVMDEGREGERRGETAWAGDWDWLKTAFPDLRCELTSAIAQGDGCAVTATVTGTHTGQLVLGEGSPVDEVAPTGRSIELNVGLFYRVKDGLIVSEHQYGWMAQMLSQLGVVGAPNATA